MKCFLAVNYPVKHLFFLFEEFFDPAFFVGFDCFVEEGEVWVVGCGEIEVGERLDACGVAVVEEGVFEVFAHVGGSDVS